jgi:DNA processing protein
MSDSRSAWAYLSRVAEAPSAPLAALVRSVGAVEAAERVRRGAVDAELDRVTSARREVDSAAADLDRIGRLGGRLLTPDDPDWPLAPFAQLSMSATTPTGSRRWRCG